MSKRIKKKYATIINNYNFKAFLKSIARQIKIKSTGIFIYNILHSRTTKMCLKAPVVKNNSLDSLRELKKYRKELLIEELKFNNVILLAPTVVQRSGITMESDFNFAYKESLIELGIPVQTIDIDTCLTERKLKKRTLLLIDGNSFVRFSDEKLNEINMIRKQGCYVTFDHPDLHASKDGKEIIGRLYNNADLGIIHNPLIELTDAMKKKTVLWPTYPFSKRFESENLIKKSDSMLFSGSSFRGLNGRRVYLNYLRKHKFPVNNQMLSSKHTGEINTAYLEYLRSLESSTMAFTTGYRSSKESLLAFRVMELILRDTVVFYEKGSFINYFLKPYEHYIPVVNAPDLLFKANHLLNNPELLTRIKIQAKEFVQSKYAHDIFWRTLNEKL